MTIEKLLEVLDSIPDEGVINQGRRRDLIAQLYVLMAQQEQPE